MWNKVWEEVQQHEPSLTQDPPKWFFSGQSSDADPVASVQNGQFPTLWTEAAFDSRQLQEEPWLFWPLRRLLYTSRVCKAYDVMPPMLLRDAARKVGTLYVLERMQECEMLKVHSDRGDVPQACQHEPGKICARTGYTALNDHHGRWQNKHLDLTQKPDACIFSAPAIRGCELRCQYAFRFINDFSNQPQ